jgi:hypothetical protein
MIDTSRWSANERVLRNLFGYPGYRAVYKLARGNMDKDFVALADTILEEAKTQPATDIALAWKALAASERAAPTPA